MLENYSVELCSMFFLIYFIGNMLNSMYSSTVDYYASFKRDISKKVKSLYSLNPLIQKFYTRPKINKALDYKHECQQYNNYTSDILSVLSSAVIIFGLVPKMLHWFILTFPNVPIVADYFFVYGIITLVMFPIHYLVGYISTFDIEQRFGFNNSDIKTFNTDILKSTFISFGLTCVCGYLINLFITSFTISPLMIAAFIAAGLCVGYIMEFLSITVFIRMFYKLEPFKNKKLSNKINKLLNSFGIKKAKIFIIDSSTRSSKSNAFIAGFGSCKKIVLFDTLLKNHTDDEILSILAHELAHGKLHHLSINRVIGFFMTIISQVVIFSLIDNVSLYHAFGFRWITPENVESFRLIGFFLAGYIISAISWISEPLLAKLSRTCEYAADKYAVLHTHNKEAMESALIKLTSENLSDPFPHPYDEALSCSHPSIMNRLEAIRNIELPKKERINRKFTKKKLDNGI